MLERPIADRIGEGREILQHKIAGLAHLQSLGGVDHVRRGHAEVQPPRGGTDMLGDRCGERNDVVLSDLLDRLDSGDVEGALLPDVAGRFGGNDAGRGHRFGGGGFDEQPRLVATLVAPDAAHLRVRVSRDH